MSVKGKSKSVARDRRRLHIRKAISGTGQVPRLVVFRSNKHIYAQIIDDTQHVTLIGTSTQSKGLQDELSGAKNKVDRAKVVGKHLAEMAKEKNIEQVVFDRAGYIYHGRVQALAEGAREGGLVF